MSGPARFEDARVDEEPLPREEGPLPPRDRWRTFGAPALAAVTVAALCLGVLLGWLVFDPHHPGDDSAEAGFARDMTEHHAQAVQMSQLVMQRSEDEDVRRLAVDIDNNQNFERGQMAAWLVEWGLPRARAGERMAWMAEAGHEHASMDLPAGVPMPGMASPTEIEELSGLTGDEAEVLYLQLMTTHHIAGVEMADAVLELGEDPEVLAAAQRMVDAQTGEIRLMSDMLEERGAQTREDVSAWLTGQESDDAATTGGHSTDH
ncbi:DUF305 domain-containing protein [Ornithinimicrobium pekingense]|uniref:DUF305 domain-containing protein n=1 Tax=Ornithinimicrobium pekingense TaxID=384677 RepID=A0ABQ2F9G4_9MICO|nr:DUF305 domain-containing protein [Ornithinimicrobium pekingense]GGK66585.1 hypothetical protein GCM10011509_13620 [Ornithinimicrobium pekingense]